MYVSSVYSTDGRIRHLFYRIGIDETHVWTVTHLSFMLFSKYSCAILL